MATGNLLLGQASGAVGSLVFARANGQQVTKARQEQVRYSNTLAQAIQRICISTAGQAYRHMQEVCCRSFQGIQPGKATHDEFMKRNVRLLRQSIRLADAQGLTYSDLRYFTPVGNDTLLPNAYIVSSGSLPTITSNIISNDPTHARLAGVGSSYQDIISFYGLQRGDILTFVFMQPDSSGIVRARSARVVLDPWSPISGKASLDVPFIAANNKINCPNPNNSGEFHYLVNDSGNIIYSMVNSDVPLIAAGVFASRRTATGSWLHSDCQLTVYEDSDILNNFTLQQAIDVANGAPIAAISPDYLNNAGIDRIPSNVSIPSQYKKVEYIYNSIRTILNTQLTFLPLKTYELGVKANGSASSYYLFQARAVGSGNIYGIGGRNLQKDFQFGFNGSYAYTPENVRSKAHVYEIKETININSIKGSVLDLNNHILYSLESSVNAFDLETANICLWGNTSSLNNRVEENTKIYYAYIKENGKYIMNYIPVRLGDVAGFWDTVSQSFITAEGLAAGQNI